MIACKLLGVRVMRSTCDVQLTVRAGHATSHCKPVSLCALWRTGESSFPPCDLFRKLTLPNSSATPRAPLSAALSAIALSQQMDRCEGRRSMMRRLRCPATPFICQERVMGTLADVRHVPQIWHPDSIHVPSWRISLDDGGVPSRFPGPL